MKCDQVRRIVQRYFNIPTLYITFSVPPKIIGDEFGKHGVPEKEKVIVTKNVTLTCPVEGDPTPEVTWWR